MNYGNDMEMGKNIEKIIQKKIAGGLYVTSTPIGNLGDISTRALNLLKSADYIACEDTRVSGKLLSHYGIGTPAIAYHDHNAPKVMPKLIGLLSQGKIIALISDAGTPLISDPGYKLVNECQKEGIMVTSIPGASALLCALTSAGMPTDNFLFCGFLSSKTSARQKELEKFAQVPVTLIYYESPKRLLNCLIDMRAVLGNRLCAVCREMTKLYEEVQKRNLDDLIDFYKNRPTPKGEIVIVVSPPEKGEGRVDDLDDAMKKALKTLSVKEAVAAVTYMTGRKRKDVYTKALELTNNE